MTKNFVDNGNGTITDSATGLMWQQKTPDQRFTFEEAEKYAAELSLAGFTDWRVPTVDELRSMVVYSRINPSCNPIFALNSSSYWSSTADVDGIYYAWGVYFGCSYVGYDCYNKKSSHYVRCVRNAGN